MASHMKLLRIARDMERLDEEADDMPDTLGADELLIELAFELADGAAESFAAQHIVNHYMHIKGWG